MYSIDKPTMGGRNLSIEDIILYRLFEEKALTKGELVSLTKCKSYSCIKKTIENMESKGYVYGRRVDNVTYYYLTANGVYEFEYRFNTYSYMYYHAIFPKIMYNEDNVSRFLKNRFYRFYMTGEWDSETLVNQYLEWCESNSLDPYIHISKKLKLE